jgi:hypothetical protein
MDVYRCSGGTALLIGIAGQPRLSVHKIDELFHSDSDLLGSRSPAPAGVQSRIAYRKAA